MDKDRKPLTFGGLPIKVISDAEVIRFVASAKSVHAYGQFLRAISHDGKICFMEAPEDPPQVKK